MTSPDAFDCVNIGPGERRKRLVAGVVSLVLGVGVVGFLWATGWPRVYRLAATVFFLGGFTGVFQAHAKTCVALASRGLRNLDSGPQAVENPAEVVALRAQAHGVLVRSWIATLAVSLAALALP